MTAEASEPVPLSDMRRTGDLTQEAHNDIFIDRIAWASAISSPLDAKMLVVRP